MQTPGKARRELWPGASFFALALVFLGLSFLVVPTQATETSLRQRALSELEVPDDKRSLVPSPATVRASPNAPLQPEPWFETELNFSWLYHQPSAQVELEVLGRLDFEQVSQHWIPRVGLAAHPKVAETEIGALYLGADSFVAYGVQSLSWRSPDGFEVRDASLGSLLLGVGPSLRFQMKSLYQLRWGMDFYFGRAFYNQSSATPVANFGRDYSQTLLRLSLSLPLTSSWSGLIAFQTRDEGSTRVTQSTEFGASFRW